MIWVLPIAGLFFLVLSVRKKRTLEIVGWGVACLFFGLVAISVTHAESVTAPTASPKSAAKIPSIRRNHRNARKSTVELAEIKNPCIYANGRINQGWTDYNASAYKAAYADAVKGLAVNKNCESDRIATFNKGFLLSVKGVAEHYLPQGDARTDLNQAEMLLEQCQTTPGIYGTHLGAECETQEENDIKATTNWEMEQYEQ